MWNKYSVYTMQAGSIALILTGILKLIQIVTGMINDKTIGYLAIISGSVFFIGVVSWLIWAATEYLSSIKPLRKKHHVKK
ncbi:hypothetical protein EFH81_24865 [Salmonella enterica]|nr:hypothetical protein [Salmonella enterica]